jgi:hypothetical protein
VLKEFKEFAMRGNVMDMAVGIIIGAGVWQNRFVAGGRRDDAAAGTVNRKNQFLGLFPQFGRKDLRNVGSRKKSACSHDQLRRVREHGDQLSNRRVRSLYRRSTGKSVDEEADLTRCAHDERMPAMRDDYSYCGKTLRPLHGAAYLDKDSEGRTDTCARFKRVTCALFHSPQDACANGSQRRLRVRPPILFGLLPGRNGRRRGGATRAAQQNR